MVKQGNDDIVAAFRQRLKKVAGFKFVPEPLPMRNNTNAVVYYFIFCIAETRGRENHQWHLPQI